MEAKLILRVEAANVLMSLAMRIHRVSVQMHNLAGKLLGMPGFDDHPDPDLLAPDDHMWYFISRVKAPNGSDAVQYSGIIGMQGELESDMDFHSLPGQVIFSKSLAIMRQEIIADHKMRQACKALNRKLFGHPGGLQ